MRKAEAITDGEVVARTANKNQKVTCLSFKTGKEDSLFQYSF